LTAAARGTKAALLKRLLYEGLALQRGLEVHMMHTQSYGAIDGLVAQGLPGGTSLLLQGWLSGPDKADRALKLVESFERLARASAEVAAEGSPEELRRRCTHLAHAADVSARLVPKLSDALPLDTQANVPDSAMPIANALLLLETGWLALRTSHVRDGLAILHSVGDMLGGALTGVMFETCGLLQLGRSKEAAELLDAGIQQFADVDGLSSATAAMLLHGLGDKRWEAHARHVMAICTNPSARMLCSARLLPVQAQRQK
jgi:hypothetical protein